MVYSLDAKVLAALCALALTTPLTHAADDPPGADAQAAPKPPAYTPHESSVQQRDGDQTGVRPDPFAPSSAEERPPVSRGSLYSDAQIRYCLAQLVRIDAVRPLLDRFEREEVRDFNAQVADYNQRCGQYRYRGSALEDAKAWLEVRRLHIERAARFAYTTRLADRRESAEARAEAAPAVAPQARAEASPAPVAAPPPHEAAQPGPVPQEPPSSGTAPVSASPGVQTAAIPSSELAAPAPVPTPSTPRPDDVPPATAPQEVATGDKPSLPASEPAAPAAPPSPIRAELPSSPEPPPAPGEQKPPSAAAASAPPIEPEPPSAAAASAPPIEPEPPSAAAAAAPPIEPEPPSTGAASAPPIEPEPPSTAAASAPPIEPEPPSAAAASAPPIEPGAISPPGASPEPSTQESPSVSAERQPSLSAAVSPPVPPSAPTAGEATSADALLAQLTHEIRLAGAQVLEPPPGTEPTGSEVTTQIEVRYAAGGFIRSILVAESSGSRAFDERALAVARNARYPDVPEQLRSREFSVKFPIVFRAAQ